MIINKDGMESQYAIAAHMTLDPHMPEHMHGAMTLRKCVVHATETKSTWMWDSYKSCYSIYSHSYAMVLNCPLVNSNIAIQSFVLKHLESRHSDHILYEGIHL